MAAGSDKFLEKVKRDGILTARLQDISGEIKKWQKIAWYNAKELKENPELAKEAMEMLIWYNTRGRKILQQEYKSYRSENDYILTDEVAIEMVKKCI